MKNKVFIDFFETPSPPAIVFFRLRRALILFHNRIDCITSILAVQSVLSGRGISAMGGVIAVEHPLVDHHLTILRDRETPAVLFRQQVKRLATLLAFQATADLPLQSKLIATPMVQTEGKTLAVRVAIVPILRAGLGMVEPLQELLPEAEVWHLGMYRDEQTATPVEYYCKLPEGKACQVGFVLDPMLATGGSVLAALETLQRWGCADLRVLSIIAARPGVERLERLFPNIKIYVAAVDPELNEHNFIVPGLGDAGDRIFNTSSGQ